ncbi:hypothetical protein SB860_39700, partial [Burkholderia sp. SIMBA_019]
MRQDAAESLSLEELLQHAHSIRPVSPRRTATAAGKKAVSLAHAPDLLETMGASQAVRDVIAERLEKTAAAQDRKA